MNDMERTVRKKNERNPHYRDTLRRLKDCLRPVEPGQEFSRRLEELCESMGARELFGNESEIGEEGGHRGIIIGIFSALPFVGVAAYALSKHLQRRRVVPLSV